MPRRIAGRLVVVAVRTLTATVMYDRTIDSTVAAMVDLSMGWTP